MPLIYMCHFKHKKGGIQMLSHETVEPRTLELLKSLMQEPAFNDMRLVGGTTLVVTLWEK